MEWGQLNPDSDQSHPRCEPVDFLADCWDYASITLAVALLALGCVDAV